MPSSSPFAPLEVTFEPERRLEWIHFTTADRPCMTPALLRAAVRHQQDLFRRSAEVRYYVRASRLPGVFNYGGDLALFVAAIEAGRRDQLLRYATLCLDALHGDIAAPGRGQVPIALVQGEALGGAFEAALSAAVIVAEDSARMGFPEILFNLFPGMGAYPLLARRVGPLQAERLLLSEQVYTAAELHTLGVVDVLVPAGQGEAAVRAYVDRQERRPTGFLAIQQLRNLHQPVSRESLQAATERWVDHAFTLRPRDLRLMRRLAAAQEQRMRRAAP